MDRGGEVVVPWEHWVCSQCLQDTPYAVWLIKLRCFKPHQHRHQIGWTLVSIEPSAMRLVQMRYPPARIDAPIPPWHAWENCPKRGSCLCPHSDVEYHTWDFIRTVFKGMLQVKWSMFLSKLSCTCSLSLRKHTEKVTTTCQTCPPVPDRCLRQVLRRCLSVLQHTLAHLAGVCQTPRARGRNGGNAHSWRPSRSGRSFGAPSQPIRVLPPGAYSMCEDEAAKRLS